MAVKNDPSGTFRKGIAQILGKWRGRWLNVLKKGPTAGCDVRETEESVGKVAAVATT